MLLWLQELLLASLVGFRLRPNQSFISLLMVQFCLPTSWTQMGVECRNNLVHESLEPRLDCSSDLLSSSNVGSGLSTLEAPQSGHPISVFRVRRFALLSMVETSHGLKDLSALFQSLHPVILRCRLLIEMLFGLGVEVLTPLICQQMRLRIPNQTLLAHLGLSLCVILVASAVLASETLAVVSSLQGHYAKICCVSFRSCVHFMSCFCNPSTFDRVSNSWNTVGTSEHVLAVPVLSSTWTSHKSK